MELNFLRNNLFRGKNCPKKFLLSGQDFLFAANKLQALWLVGAAYIHESAFVCKKCISILKCFCFKDLFCLYEAFQSTPEYISSVGVN